MKAEQNFKKAKVYFSQFITQTLKLLTKIQKHIERIQGLLIVFFFLDPSFLDVFNEFRELLGASIFATLFLSRFSCYLLLPFIFSHLLLFSFTTTSVRRPLV